jgi:DNA-binding CsgD family transcriptional regulator
VLRSRRDVVPALLAAVAERLGGAPGAANGVCLVAPSGAGKSHLLREFCDRLSTTALRAGASEASSTRPLSVAAQLFGPHAGRQGYVERVDRLIAAQPIVLVVDDVQFADAESVGLLRDLITLDAPITLVATGNSVPAPLQRAHVDGLALPPLDRLDIDGFVHDRTGCWPGARLRALLESIADNALHLVAVLDALLRAGTTVVGTTLDLVNDDAGAVATDLTATSAVDRLTGSELDVARVLAVLGRPADPDEIAGLLGAAPMSLVGTLQRLLDAGVLAARGTELEFSHDAFRQATYAAIPEPLRRTMHRAVALTVQEAVEHAGHVLAARPEPAELLAAVTAAVEDLGDAPGVTAALLGRATQATDDADAAAQLAIGRARALARDGQLRLAAEVAAEALVRARDPAVVSELRRVEIFTLGVGGHPAEAIDLLDATLSDPLPDGPRRVLTEHRRMLRLLAGREPVPLEPFSADPRELTLNGLIAELLRRHLLGDTGVAVEYAWAAAQRTLTTPVDRNEGLSADVWTPYVTLAHSGADAARDALHEMITLREERGAQWQSASHHAIGGAIEMSAGRLDDAAAHLGTALTEAARMELDMASATAGAALVDVLLGNLPDARRRLDGWSASPEFGLPHIERARVSLLEAERRYPQAANLAAATWTRAECHHHFGWLAAVAPDFARVALRANDAHCLGTIAGTLARIPAPAGRPGRAAVQLATLLTGPGSPSVATVAPHLADEAVDAGDRLFGMLALEEAAVAAAVGDDKDGARALGRRAIELAEDAGARTITTRVAGRLRAAGARLGSTTTRSRPDFGWDSLTPTERRIVDTVAAGATGPEIARQLHLSPRTVQTHVSHALTKLGLANRVELAAAAVRRNLSVLPD